MKKKILILGTGGHAKACIDLISKCKDYNLIGLISKNSDEIGKQILNTKVVASDKDLVNLKKKCKNLMIGIGFLGNSSKKEFLYKKILNLGFQIPRIISPSSYISKFAKIDEGVNIFHDCIVGPDTLIEYGVIINNKCLIEHDVRIERFAHISTNCVINGNTVIGKKSFIGSGTLVKNDFRIKPNSFIRMGSIIK
tara:strand:- start:345 stop:929 length:585 start_codon:yes stop_codon:yes gene_type:complete